MTVRVVLFAMARELAETGEATLDLPTGATVGAARQALGERFPRLHDLLRRSMVAIDEQYADDDATLAPNAEVAIIPPVSGGAPSFDKGGGCWPRTGSDLAADEESGTMNQSKED